MLNTFKNFIEKNKETVGVLTLIAFFALPILISAAVTPQTVGRDSNGFIRPLIQTDYIQAPNFVATSTTATSTFAGHLTVGTDLLVVDSTNGNVGFGTASPSQIFELSDIAPAIRMTDTTAGADDVDIFLNQDVFKIIHVGIKDLLAINTDTGAVGVATSTPAYKLDIYGDFRIDNGGVVITPKAATDGATITIDWSTGNTHYVTLGGNRTLAFSNVSVGQSITVYVTQDGTGSRTLTQPSSVTGPDLTLTTTAGKTDILVYSTATSTDTVHGRISPGE